MHRRTLTFILFLFILHLTSKCGAQEPTPTTGAVDTTTDALPTNGTIHETITDNSSDSTFTSSSSLGVSSPETPEAPSVLPSELPTPATDLPPAITEPSTSHPFVVKVSQPIIQECDEVTIKWVGTDLIPPFRVLYAKGTGEMGDDSILDVDVQLIYTNMDHYTWQVPPTWMTSPGNVTRITVMENWGMSGRSAITWLPWKAGTIEQCPNDPALTDTSSSTRSLEGVSTIQTTELFITTFMPAPIGMTETLPNLVPNASGEPQIITMILTLPSEPTATIPSNGNIIPVNGPTITAPPIANRPTTTAVNTLRPPASIIADPQSSNGSNQQGSNSPNPQGSTGPNGVTAVELVRTFVVAIGESSTITIVTHIPQGAQPTGSFIWSQQQQSTTPATLPSNGQKNSTLRRGLPPAAIGAIVGTLLGAITLWILLLVWLKRRKRVRKSEEPEEGRIIFSPTENIRVTPFTPPPSEPHYIIKSKQRVMEEVPRPISPGTSIADTGSQSQLFTVPMTHSLEMNSEAGTSDPFRRASRSLKQKSLI